MKTLENLKMNQSVEINFKQASELMRATEGEYEFDNLNESTEKETGFEEVQNRKYSIRKIGRKGSKIYAGSVYETKADVGIFELEMTYDYRHPANFAQNRNNVNKNFKIKL